MSAARTVGSGSLGAILGAGLMAFLQANGPQIIAAATGTPVPRTPLERCEARVEAGWQARDVNKSRWWNCQDDLRECREECR